MTMSRVVPVPKCRRTWRTMLLSGAAIPRLARTRPDSAYRIGDEAIVLPGPPQDFGLTLPGAELTTGQTAEVLTRLPQGPALYWEITALCAHRSELVEGLLERATYRGTVVTGFVRDAGWGPQGSASSSRRRGPTWTRCTAGSCSGADWNLSREFQSMMYALSSRAL